MVIFVHGRPCSDIPSVSAWYAALPDEFKEKLLNAKIVKVEHDGTPPLVRIHLLTEAGCAYVLAPAGRTVSLENFEEVQSDHKCKIK